jgi:hypothetical protein
MASWPTSVTGMAGTAARSLAARSVERSPTLRVPTMTPSWSRQFDHYEKDLPSSTCPLVVALAADGRGCLLVLLRLA